MPLYVSVFTFPKKQLSSIRKQQKFNDPQTVFPQNNSQLSPPLS